MSKQAKSILVGLANAEDTLAADLVLSLHVDGSGSVDDIDRTEIFMFRKIEELLAWFESPRIFSYAESGELVGA